MSRRVAKRFLERVWAAQPTTDGFVFTSVKDWDDNSWEDHPQDYPTESVSIPTVKDLYFAPCIFEQDQRRKNHALPGRWLYADLDEVDPRSLDIEPTIAWETSPGRYQCLWQLQRPLRPEQLELLNQKLTYHTGADKGGWSLTKVLRVPGSISTKREYEYHVQSLWTNGPVHAASDIYDVVKKITTPRDTLRKLPTLKLPKASASRLRRRAWDKLTLDARRLLKASEAPEGTRSEKLWKLERLLVEAGLPPEHVFVLVKASVWNKYRGQQREDQQLWREVMQAVQTNGGTNHSKAQPGGKSKKASSNGSSNRSKSTSARAKRGRSTNNSSSSEGEKLSLVAYADFIGKRISKPMWMVEGVWSESAHGVLAGEPKTYKSVIATDLAMSVASGTRFLNHFQVPQTGPVIMVQKENDEREVQDRIARIAASKSLWASASLNGNNLEFKAGADLPVHFMNNTDFDLTDPDDIKWLRRKVRKINPVLIVFDPLYLLAPGVDENSAAQMTPVLERLLVMKQRYNVGTLLIHHYSKPNAENPRKGAQRISGSGTFHRWYESALLLERPDLEEPRVKISPEHRGHSPQGGFWADFDLGSEEDLHYAVEVEPSKREKAQGQRGEIIEVLQGHNNRMPLLALAELTGIGARAIERLVIRDDALAMGRGKVNGKPTKVVRIKGEALA